MRKLIIATTNKGKFREMSKALEELPLQIIPLPSHIYVEEGEESYWENAARKAMKAVEMFGEIALADDSGLEVLSLGGFPGSRSKRIGQTDEERINTILRMLEGKGWEEREAIFRCVIAIATPDGRLERAEGIVRGYIAYEPKGEGGFGYDPIFFLPEKGKTMAELDVEEKNAISHRGKALKEAKKILQRLCNECK
ncbi:RdgB/HAM1 family non-canonical purine NTP pyrophosphatase [bacterium]|nr:RdgB/HAM1 family non-canonical purine NTP pyrophosphatase [bacterium]